jgi:lysophospholipase L1-like esterase
MRRSLVRALLSALWLLLGLQAAAAEPALNLTGTSPADLLFYDADSGRWVIARYTGEPAGFVYSTGTWPAGLTVLLARLDADALSDAVLYEPASGRFALATNTGTGFRLTEGQWAPGLTIFRADFNGDTRDDLLLYDFGTGEAAEAVNDGIGGFGYHRQTLSPRQQLVIADFSQDGRSDVFAYDAVSGDFELLFADPATGRLEAAQAGGWTPGWSVSPAQLDPDGRPDLLLYRQDTGEWVEILTGPDATRVRFTSGAWEAGRRLVTADFDGDGVDEVLLYDYFDGQWTKYAKAGTRFALVAEGAWPADALLFASDFDRNGATDLLLYDRRAGRYGVAFGSAGGFSEGSTGTWTPGGLIATRLGDRLVATPTVAGLLGPDGGPRTFVPPSSRTLLTTSRIVAFGDSITAGTHPREELNAAPVWESTHANYPDQLAGLLTSRYPTAGVRVANYGLPGELAADGRDRIGSVLDTERPQLVLILEGVNDLGNGRSPSQIASDLQTMVSRAQARGVRILLARLTPVTAPYDDDGSTRPKVEDVNRRIDTIANQFGLGPAVDLYRDVEGLLASDGLHPSDAGYAQIARSFFDRIVRQFENTVRPVFAETQ